MKRSYIKRAIWHLGGRKKQKGGFSPILRALARPLLVPPTSAVDGEVLKGLGKQIFGGGRGGRKRRFRKRRQLVKRFSYT